MSISFPLGVISLVQSEFNLQKRSTSHVSGRILSPLPTRWLQGIPLAPVYTVAGTVLPFPKVIGVVGNSGRQCRTYSTPVLAPLSNSASGTAALVTGTSRFLEVLVVCGDVAVGDCVVVVVDEVDDVVGGDEGDAEAEAFGKVPTPLFNHFLPLVLCHTGAFAWSRRSL